MNNEQAHKKDFSGIAIALLFILLLVAGGAAFIYSSVSYPSIFVFNEFESKCKEPLHFSDGMSFSCKEIKDANLTDAYLNKKIVKHGRTLYEIGTQSEVKAGKDNGYYCLNAGETWDHIGELRCVVFKYSSLGQSGNNFFVNEKSDYRSGFTYYLPDGQYSSWENFSMRYDIRNPEHKLMICGVITQYEGRPQIVRSKNDLRFEGIGGDDGIKEDYIVDGEPLYAWTCSYINRSDWGNGGGIGGHYRPERFGSEYHPYAFYPDNL